MIAHVADKLCLQLCTHTLIAPYFTGTPLNILPVAPLYALVSVLALATKVSNIAARKQPSVPSQLLLRAVERELLQQANIVDEEL